MNVSDFDELKANGLRKLLLAFVERQEIGPFQFHGASHVEHIEGAGAKLRRVAPAQFGGVAQGGAPENVDLLQMPFHKVGVQTIPKSNGLFLSHSGSMDRKSDRIDDLCAPKVRHGKRAAEATAPPCHFARTRLVQVEQPQRAGIDIDLFSVHRDSPRGAAVRLPQSWALA